MNNEHRLIRTFGKREIELAAIWIVDHRLLDAIIHDSDFDHAPLYEKEGFRRMIRDGLVTRVRSGFVVTEDTKRIIHEAGE